MIRPFIVIGDRTTHGGTVISADVTSDIHGKCMARVGDMVVCPKCKGVFPITSGAPDMLDGSGRAYARHMDATACGARLISAQVTTTWSDVASPGGPAAEADAQASAPQWAAPTSSGICLDCLRKASRFGSAVVIRE